MLKISLALLILGSLSACTTSKTSQEIEEAGKIVTEEVIEEEVLSFEEWLKANENPNEEIIFPTLDQMTPEEIIQDYKVELDIADDWYSVAYHDFISLENYNYRNEEIYTAASTTKVLVAILYYDLIDSAAMSLDQEIPYSEDDYQDGNGDITAVINSGKAQPSYPLDYIIQEMIVQSDNTAWNMLREYYRNNYGPLGEGMRNVVQDSKYSTNMLEDNQTSASLLEESLLEIADNEKYIPLLDYMRKADKGLYLKYYIAEDTPVKHGQLFELQHHMGIFEINEQAVYSLVLLTRNLDEEQANQFLGGINLQLATQAEYLEYVRDFGEQK